MLKVWKSFRNRATAKDRPSKSVECRQVSLASVAGTACAKAGGHNHEFIRGDRYGCCTRCGDEVLS